MTDTTDTGDLQCICGDVYLQVDVDDDCVTVDIMSTTHAMGVSLTPAQAQQLCDSLPALIRGAERNRLQQDHAAQPLSHSPVTLRTVQ